MIRYAVLCGCAPDCCLQKKLAEMHDFLINGSEERWAEKEILIFPNGVSELVLELTLNNAIEEAASDAGKVLLYFFARTQEDLDAGFYDPENSDAGLFRLGEGEIRMDVIAWYEQLAARLGVKFCVSYDFDGEFLDESTLGWEPVES